MPDYAFSLDGWYDTLVQPKAYADETTERVHIFYHILELTWMGNVQFETICIEWTQRFDSDLLFASFIPVARFLQSLDKRIEQQAEP